jgi:hypothetical protein
VCGMQSPQLDRFARDARAWKHCAEINYIASGHLFASSNLFVYFTAATLGHHALEMYLKSALICEGMTVFNPVIVESLRTPVTHCRGRIVPGGIVSWTSHRGCRRNGPILICVPG